MHTTEIVSAHQAGCRIPAELIRYRFDQPTREALSEIARWDWDAEKIFRAQAFLELCALVAEGGGMELRCAPRILARLAGRRRGPAFAEVAQAARPESTRAFALRFSGWQRRLPSGCVWLYLAARSGFPGTPRKIHSRLVASVCGVALARRWHFTSTNHVCRSQSGGHEKHPSMIPGTVPRRVQTTKPEILG